MTRTALGCLGIIWLVTGCEDTCIFSLPEGFPQAQYDLPQVQSQAMETFFSETGKIAVNVPFTYKIDDSVPEEYRAAMVAGIEAWNPVFSSRIGFDLFQPASGSASLVVTCQVLEQPTFHLGAFTTPPGSTEFHIPADTGLLVNRIRRYGRYFGELVPEYPLDVPSMSDQDLINHVLQSFMAHEAGHVLGLKHNLMASVDVSNYGEGCPSSSLMDYCLPPYLCTRPAPFDRAAIDLLYFNEPPQATFLHWADDPENTHLLARWHDIGPDPLLFAELKLMGLFEDRSRKSGWSLMDQASFAMDLQDAAVLFWILMSDANSEEAYALAAFEVFGVFIKHGDRELLSTLLDAELVAEMQWTYGYTRYASSLADRLDVLWGDLSDRGCGQAAGRVDEIIALLR